MRYRFLPAAGLAVIAALMISGHAVDAQTVAAGPYYATPSWDQTLPCTALGTCPRFIVLSNFNNQAVLDRETGLVWERAPDPGRKGNLVNAYGSCLMVGTGGRLGWRLPTASEFGSLLDSRTSGFVEVDVLPAGHPFTVGAGFPVFWSSTIPLLEPRPAAAIEAEFFPNGDVILNPQSSDFMRRYPAENALGVVEFSVLGNRKECDDCDGVWDVRLTVHGGADRG